MKQLQRYLVTGGAGFIGSHITERLLKNGSSVVVLDDFSTGTHQNIRHLENHAHFTLVNGDVTDTDLLVELAADTDTIIHLAASVGVKNIAQYPVNAIECNVLGTSAVLKAAVKTGNRVLITSSSEVYGKSSKLPFGEQDDVVFGPSCNRRWAYANSKLVDEYLAFAYRDEFDLPVIVVRLFNTIGVRQSAEFGMVVPRLVRQSMAQEPLLVYGDGQQTRCFCSVHDVTTAISGLLDTPLSEGKLFNIGSTNEISIQQLAEKIIAVTGSSSRINNIDFSSVYGTQFDDIKNRVPDISYIQELINWEPKTTVEEVIQEMMIEHNWS